MLHATATCRTSVNFLKGPGPAGPGHCNLNRDVPFVLETQGFLHAWDRVLLCKIARLQGEYADER